MSRGPKPLPRPSSQPTPPIAPPEGLSDAARDEWVRVVALLSASRVIHELDEAALTIYVTSFAHYKHAEAAIRKDGTVVVGTTGTPVTNPYLRVQSQCWDRIKTLLPELGLTPSGRSRLNIGGDDDEIGDELDGLQ